MKILSFTFSDRMLGVALMASSLAIGSVAAEEKHAGKSADEIAKELANPNNDLARLTFKNQYYWYGGDLPDAYKQDNYTLLFQPIFPFSLGTTESGNKETFFLRPAVPLVIDQPVPGPSGFHNVSTLGDIGFDAAYALSTKNGLLFAAGMVGSLPTAVDGVAASKELRLGPELLIAQVTKYGVFGIFPSHLWDVASYDEGKATKFSRTEIQPIIALTPGGGWQIASKPKIDYHWILNQWTVPINLAVAKTIKFGDLPVQIELEGSYYIERPDAFDQEWMIGLNITPVVPNFIENMFKGK